MIKGTLSFVMINVKVFELTELDDETRSYGDNKALVRELTRANFEFKKVLNNVQRAGHCNIENSIHTKVAVRIGSHAVLFMLARKRNVFGNSSF